MHILRYVAIGVFVHLYLFSVVSHVFVRLLDCTDSSYALDC